MPVDVLLGSNAHPGATLTPNRARGRAGRDRRGARASADHSTSRRRIPRGPAFLSRTICSGAARRLRAALVYAPEPLGHARGPSGGRGRFRAARIDVAADRIALTASTSEAYSLLFKLLCDPGDEVLIPRPSYPLFDHLTRLDAVIARSVRARVPRALVHRRRGASSGHSAPRTRAVLLVSPNNPTGSSSPRPSSRRSPRSAGEHDVAIISDEVFADYDLLGARCAPDGLLLGRTDVLGFTLGGLSKSIGLPQAKLAWIAISGRTTRSFAARARLELASRHISCRCRRQCRLAAAELLERGAADSQQIQARIRGNYQRTARSRQPTVPACELLRSRRWLVRCSAGYHRSCPRKISCCRLLTEDGVLVHPGYFFDFPARVVSDRQPASARRTISPGHLADPEPIRIGARSRDEPTPDVAAQDCSFRCFPARRRASWGIGDIGDIAPVAAWLAAAGQRVLQLLPINEMAAGPAVALLRDERDGDRSDLHSRHRGAGVHRARRRASLDRTSDRAQLASARQTAARRLSHRARVEDPRARARLSISFVDARVGRRHAARARARARSSTPERWWLDDYALFRALHEREAHRPWTDWPAALRDRDPRRSRALAATLCRRACCFASTCSGLRHEQWRRARAAAQRTASRLFGDLPFMVDGDSADVWARQADFHLDASVGVPPDAFSATGQDWGMPAYRWDAIAAGGFRLAARPRAAQRRALRRLPRRSSRRLLSHLFARRVNGGGASFEPATEPEQLELGERVLSISFARPARKSSPRISASCRTSSGRRWRACGVAGLPRVPLGARVECRRPAVSRPGGLSGDIGRRIGHARHRTAWRMWWDAAPEERKAADCGDLPVVQHLAGDQRPAFSSAVHLPAVRDALLETLFGVGIELAADARAGCVRLERSHQRAGDGRRPDNWTFRLPWPSDRLADEPAAEERQRNAQGSGRRSTGGFSYGIRGSTGLEALGLATCDLRRSYPSPPPRAARSSTPITTTAEALPSAPPP